MIMKRLQLLLLLMVSALSFFAQPYCQVSTYTVRNGIPSNSITGLGCAQNGLMWFSTLNGLCCYDGHRFTSFRNKSNRDNEKAVNRLTMVKLDTLENVWTITHERSVYMFDTRTCTFIDVNGLISQKFGKNPRIRAIYDGSSGAQWLISFNDESSYRIDINNLTNGEGIEKIDMGTDHLLSNAIKKVECDSHGDEWVFTEKGLVRYHDKFIIEQPIEHMAETADRYVFATLDGRMYTYSVANRLQMVNLPGNVTQITTLSEYDDSKVFVTTNAGLYIYDAKLNNLIKVDHKHDGVVAEVFQDSKKRFWCYTDAGGIIMVDFKKQEKTNVTASAEKSMEYTVSEQIFFHEDVNGTIWLAQKGGPFGYYEEKTQKHNPLLLKSDRESYGKLVTFVKNTVDNKKNIWFNSSRDIHNLQFKYDSFKFTDVYSNTEIRSLLADNKGRVWAGTYNGVLAVYDRNDKLIGYLNSQGQIQSKSTIFSPRIYSLKQDSKGRIWIGTKGSGLFIYDDNGKMQHYMHNPNDKYSLSYDEIYDIDFDEKGNIWVATFVGGLNLVRETAEGLRFYNHNNEMPQYLISKYGKIRRVTHDGKGTVILSTNNGLLTFSNSFESPANIRFYENRFVPKNKTSLLANDVLQTLVMRNGDIYVLTMGGGAQKVLSDNLLSDSLHFEVNDKMSSSESIIQSMLEDSQGSLWLIREGTIDKYNPNDKTLQHYGSSTIGDNIEFSEALPSYCSLSDMMIAPARGGFVRFGMENLSKSNYRPNIIFTSVQYQGEHQRYPILNNPRLEVPADKRNLTIYFSALEYTDNDLVEYAYRLEGYDDDWNYVGAVNNASLSHLSSGTYKLKVKSTNSEGVEVDNVAELDIYVHPTFWETGWAKLIYVVLFALLLYLVFYIYNLQNRSRMERKLNDMKTRFFTDISHKLRTPLTLIGGPVAEVLNNNDLSDNVRTHLEMVQRNSTKMLQLVNKMLKYSMERGVYISDEEIPQSSAVNDMAEEQESQAEEASTETVDDVQQRATILVVEDNDDLRIFLCSILGNEYNVLQAENGQRGLEIAESDMPDFIITDVMMPVMDGLTMIKKIKQNSDICHIPIIVLSAKASMEDRIEGLKSGIDDYITKPFSATYLKLRVSNIISHRRIIQQTFVEQLKPDDKKTYKLESPEIVNADNEMMKKLMDFMEDNISNTEMKIEDLADAVNLGRSVFYGKIKSITGMTPVDFVRHIRMLRAEELITRSDYSFSQIAYMVGFSDPKYFSKCFKKETGMTPSEYRSHKDLRI